MRSKQTKMAVVRLCQGLILFVLCFGTDHAKQDDDYVDPFDLLNFDPIHVRMKNKAVPEDTQPSPGSVPPSTENPKVSPTTENPKVSPTTENPKVSPTTENPKVSPIETPKDSPNNASCRSLFPLFRQYLRQLVHVLQPVVGHPSQLEDVSLQLLVSGHDLHTLLQYSEEVTSDVHSVHETLSHMIQQARRTHHLGKTFYWLEERMGLSMETLFLMSTISVCVAVIVLTVSKLRFTWIVIIIFGISGLFTWIEMFQKEKAAQEKLFMERDNHCAGNLADLTFYSRFWNYLGSTLTFQDEECREFYHAMYVNPVFKVTPVEACAVAFVKTVVTPMEVVGHGIKRFLIGLLKDLPVQIQTIVLMFVAGPIVLSLFLARGYRFKIPWLLSIEPSHPPHISASISAPISAPVSAPISGQVEERAQQMLEGLSGEFERLSLRDSERQLRHPGASCGNPECQAKVQIAKVPRQIQNLDSQKESDQAQQSECTDIDISQKKARQFGRLDKPGDPQAGVDKSVSRGMSEPKVSPNDLQCKVIDSSARENTDRPELTPSQSSREEAVSPCVQHGMSSTQPSTERVSGGQTDRASAQTDDLELPDIFAGGDMAQTDVLKGQSSREPSASHKVPHLENVS